MYPSCKHYERWLFPVHPDEKKWYFCRLCYESKTNTLFPRKRVKLMYCTYCSCAQSVYSSCQNPDCTVYDKSHHYYCNICHLWDNKKNHPKYHCNQCGICRVGLQDDYTHCCKCGMCVPKQKPHNCWGEIKNVVCPICYLECDEHGRDPLSFLECGHVLHTECMQELWLHAIKHKQALKCPTCNKIF